MWHRGTLILALLGLCASSAHADRPYLNRLQKAMLEGGKVIVSPQTPTDDSGVAALAVGLVEAPIAKVWPVVRDCQHHKHFMPKAMDSAITKRFSPTQFICYLKASTPFPLPDLYYHALSTVKRLGKGWRMSWTLSKGNYKRYNGRWEAWPYDAQRTLLVYSIDVDPDISVPDALLRGGWIDALPGVFRAVRRRVGA